MRRKSIREERNKPPMANIDVARAICLVNRRDGAAVFWRTS